MKKNVEHAKELMKKGDLTITDALDAYIELNAIIGVGLITLAEELGNYIRNQKKYQTIWAKARLEDLRAALREEEISYGELAELQELAKYIEPDDVELLEAAGVPEGGID